MGRFGVFRDVVGTFLLGWLYLGCLGSDKPPIVVAKLPPEGGCHMPPLKRYTKHWTCGIPTFNQYQGCVPGANILGWGYYVSV